MGVPRLEYQLEVYDTRYKDCLLHLETDTPPPSFNVGDFVQLSTAGGLVTEDLKGVVDRVLHFMCGTERTVTCQTRLFLKRLDA